MLARNPQNAGRSPDRQTRQCNRLPHCCCSCVQSTEHHRHPGGADVRECACWREVGFHFVFQTSLDAVSTCMARVKVLNREA